MAYPPDPTRIEAAAGDSDLTTLRDALEALGAHSFSRVYEDGVAALGRLVALLEAGPVPSVDENRPPEAVFEEFRELHGLNSGSARGARSGADLIAAERSRQMAAEGWTTEHDDKHDGGELAAAACCYATEPRIRANIMLSPDGEANVNVPGSGYDPRHWPAEWTGWWKPCPDDRVRELVKAGALVAAEIDRLQRAVSTSGGSAATPNAPEPYPFNWPGCTCVPYVEAGVSYHAKNCPKHEPPAVRLAAQNEDEPAAPEDEVVIAEVMRRLSNLVADLPARADGAVNGRDLFLALTEYLAPVPAQNEDEPREPEPGNERSAFVSDSSGGEALAQAANDAARLADACCDFIDMAGWAKWHDDALSSSQQHLRDTTRSVLLNLERFEDVGHLTPAGETL